VESWEFVQCGWCGVCYEEVEGVVCVAVVIGFDVSVFQHLEQRMVRFALGGECYDGRCAAADGGAGSYGLHQFDWALALTSVNYLFRNYLRCDLYRRGAARQDGRERQLHQAGD